MKMHTNNNFFIMKIRERFTMPRLLEVFSLKWNIIIYNMVYNIPGTCMNKFVKINFSSCMNPSAIYISIMFIYSKYIATCTLCSSILEIYYIYI